MDTLTHALSGALLVRASAPTVIKPGDLSLGARIAVCTAAAAFPDADICSSNAQSSSANSTRTPQASRSSNSAYPVLYRIDHGNPSQCV